MVDPSVRIPECPEGCEDAGCHCLSCEQTGVPLDPDSYCGDCVALDAVNDATETQRYPYGRFTDWSQVRDWLRYAE